MGTSLHTSRHSKHWMWGKMSLQFIAALFALLACVQGSSDELKPCPGDTRGDRRCNHDATHRVCAKIGVPDTSFWTHTGQMNWCNEPGNYGGAHGAENRCPWAEPTWCICKWATADWIKGEGCNESVEF